MSISTAPLHQHL